MLFLFVTEKGKITMEKEFLKVSIIVPVYNVEKYLKQCMKSILNQTYKNFEVILIDDGSKDKSGSLCDAYMEEDKRVRVIHKENGGLMSAWMKGVESCTTDYIVFVDSDDWIGERMVELYVKAITLYDSDMVIGNMRIAKEASNNRASLVMEPNHYCKEQIMEKIYPVMLNTGKFQSRGIPVSRWGKMIKKNILMDNLKYCDQRISFAEDLNIIFPILLDCKDIIIIDEEDADYYYRINPTSILHSYNATMYKQIQLVYNQLFCACKDKKKEGFEPQLLADYLAAIVQCYKNELMNDKKFSLIKKNINNLRNNEMLFKAISVVDWHQYSKLNVVIISCINRWNFIDQNIITFILYKLKQYRVKKLLNKGKV